jgi:hypothetical protein
MRVCSFTKLDDLKKNCGDADLIAVLVYAKKFSCFEKQWILNRITDLGKKGKIEFIHEPWFAYPWTGVRRPPTKI